jgi:hypothetical protein
MRNRSPGLEDELERRKLEALIVTKGAKVIQSLDSAQWIKCGK